MAEKSFREILEAKLGPARSPEPLRTEGAFEAPDWSQLIVEPLECKRKGSYPRPARPIRPKKTEKPEKQIGLNSAEQIAAARLLGFDADQPLFERALRAAYRKIIRELHPDLYPAGLSSAERERRTLEFQRVHDAYLVLSR